MAHTRSLENAMAMLDGLLAKSAGAWYLVEPTSDLVATSAPSSTKAYNSFHSYLISELPIQLHSGIGRRASVDYALILSDRSGPFTVIPIEAKMKIEDRYFGQLASYLNKVSTYSRTQDQMAIGALLTPFLFMLGLSPFKWSDGKAVPIVYVSPPIRWRDLDFPLVDVSPNGIILLCLAHENR